MEQSTFTLHHYEYLTTLKPTLIVHTGIFCGRLCVLSVSDQPLRYNAPPPLCVDSEAIREESQVSVHWSELWEATS